MWEAQHCDNCDRETKYAVLISVAHPVVGRSNVNVLMMSNDQVNQTAHTVQVSFERSQDKSLRDSLVMRSLSNFEPLSMLLAYSMVQRSLTLSTGYRLGKGKKTLNFRKKSPQLNSFTSILSRNSQAFLEEVGNVELWNVWLWLVKWPHTCFERTFSGLHAWYACSSTWERSNIGQPTHFTK